MPKATYFSPNCNGLDMTECPFDKNHRIAKIKLYYHITRCRRNHIYSRKICCRFNTCHWIEPEDKEVRELGQSSHSIIFCAIDKICVSQQHERNCPDRLIVQNYIDRIRDRELAVIRNPPATVHSPTKAINNSYEDNWDHVRNVLQQANTRWYEH